MKKKIKDLTEKEIKQICEKSSGCHYGCPLCLYGIGVCFKDVEKEIRRTRRNLKDFLNWEVEVDE